MQLNTWDVEGVSGERRHEWKEWGRGKQSSWESGLCTPGSVLLLLPERSLWIVDASAVDAPVEWDRLHSHVGRLSAGCSFTVLSISYIHSWPHSFKYDKLIRIHKEKELKIGVLFHFIFQFHWFFEILKFFRKI